MKLTRKKKIALAIATAWPPLYILSFVASVAISVIRLLTTPKGTPPSPVVGTVFMFILPLHLLTMLVMAGLLAIYTRHASRNDKLDQKTQLLWMTLLFVGNVFAMPFYFSKFVLPLKDDPA